MEASFVFYDINEKKLQFEDQFIDMDDSVRINTLPRIGESIVFDTGTNLEEFLQLKIEERKYLEEFLIVNYQGKGGQYQFTVIDIVHFTMGDFGSIHIMPKLK